MPTAKPYSCLLTEDFVGTVSAGMPHGVGGEHRGAVDMITGVWARIASVYEMHVDPLDFLQVDDERVVVLGRYWGPARDGGSSVKAPRRPHHHHARRPDRGVATDHRHCQLGHRADVLTRQRTSPASRGQTD